MRVVIGLVVVVASACGMPRDPDGTLDRVTGGTMVVGVIASHPWSILSEGTASGGVEVRLVEAFAGTVDAAIEWVDGSEEHLLSALEEGHLDLVIGGLTISNPWSGRVTFTRPYVTTFLGVGVPDRDHVDDDVDDMRIAVERHSLAAALLSETGAEILEVEHVTDADGPVAAETWVFDDLGLHDTGVRLDQAEHVMAVRHGENAWLTAIERFLAERRADVERLLAQADVR